MSRLVTAWLRFCNQRFRRTVRLPTMSGMSTPTATVRRPRHAAFLLAAVLAIAWGLAGCSSSGDSTSSGAADAAYDAGGGDGGEAEAAEGNGGDSLTSTGAADDDRSIIITGAMYMTVDDPIEVADRATALVERAGGRIDSRSERAASEYEGGWAELTMRIPTRGLDSVVEDLRALGTVDEFSTDSADVTREVQDLDAKISTLRASTDRIQALLADAEKIADIITLEDELAGRQAELEGLEARQRGLDDRVAMSTIALSLTTEPVVFVDDSPSSFWSGLVSGWNGLMAFLTGTLVVVGVLLPWLGLAALIAAAVLVTVRIARARKARRAPAVSPAPPAEPALAPASGSGPDSGGTAGD